jgi:hypothetical protein
MNREHDHPVPPCHISGFADYTFYQAEETLFKVHAYFFIRDSPYFKDVLVNDYTKAEVAATQQVLVRLGSDVKRVDFERLLAILYLRCSITLLCYLLSLMLLSVSLESTPS